MRVEVLFLDGCPSHERLLPRLEQLIDETGVDAEVVLRRVESLEAADAERFLGSPTVRVDGRDIDPTAAGRDDYGLKCRLYRTAEGATGTPPDAWVRGALERDRDLRELACEICRARCALPPERQHIALGLYRLLAEGQPLPPPVAAERLGVTDAEVEQAMTTWPAALRDDRGRVIGYGGLSLRETSHRFRVDGRRLYTWCAWDALFLPELLGIRAEVRSQCATSGKAIELTVSATGVERVAPASTVISMVVPDDPFGPDVVDTFCCHVRYFRSEQAAQPWLEDRDGAFALTVADAFELGRHANHIVFGDALD